MTRLVVRELPVVEDDALGERPQLYQPDTVWRRDHVTETQGTRQGQRGRSYEL